MSTCDCPTWKANIDKIDAPLILAQIRNPNFLVDFVKFVYCPWCGEALRSRQSCEGEQPYICHGLATARSENERLRGLLREARTIGAMQIPDWLDRIDAALSTNSLEISRGLVVADQPTARTGFDFKCECGADNWNRYECGSCGKDPHRPTDPTSG